jgi:pimeloyl-ACP methyl ester carboxylesterase
MDGVRRTVTSADGVRIGMLTAGHGPGLLLVHGGMGRLERWLPIWDLLTSQWRITAIDRRGRGSSGDTEGPYRITDEYDDIRAVAQMLATEQGGPIDVFGHSYGATCALGAAAGGAPFDRMVLYEPAGPGTVSPQWIQRVSRYITDGQTGRAMGSFLTEIIGLTDGQVDQLRRTHGASDVLTIVAATMPREGRALACVGLPGLAEQVSCPTLLVSGSTSPPWAQVITEQLAVTLAHVVTAVLTGNGHEAIDTAPHLVRATLGRYLLERTARR